MMLWPRVDYHERAGRLERVVMQILVGALQTALTFLLGSLLIAIVLGTATLTLVAQIPAPQASSTHATSITNEFRAPLALRVTPR